MNHLPRLPTSPPGKTQLKVGSQVLTNEDRALHLATVVEVFATPDEFGNTHMVQLFNPVKRREMDPVRRSIKYLRKPYDLPPPPADDKLRKSTSDEQYQIDKGAIVFVPLYDKGLSVWCPAEVLWDRVPKLAASFKRRVRFLHEDKVKTRRRRYMRPMFSDSAMQLDTDENGIWPRREIEKEIDPYFRVGKKGKKEVYEMLERKQYLTHEDFGVDRDPQYDCSNCADWLLREDELEMATKLCPTCYALPD